MIASVINVFISVSIAYREPCSLLDNLALIFLILDLDNPTFNTSSQNTIGVIKGRFLSVLCSANSSSNRLFYFWIKKDKYGGDNRVSSTNTLVFQSIQKSDATTYICTALLSSATHSRSTLVIDVYCEFTLIHLS